MSTMNEVHDKITEAHHIIWLPLPVSPVTGICLRRIL